MPFPTEFIAQMHTLLGPDEAQCFFDSLNQPAPVSIRINPFKAAPSLLAALNSRLARVPWCSEGYYLPERLTFTFDPLFHAGHYYVQEASSMFVGRAVQRYVDAPVLALDLCASPGGKSTHLRSVLPAGSYLVANEVIRSRANVLAENLTKWGHPDVMVTSNDPADFAAANVLYDLILADVPCSGEGMFRKDPAAISEWSLENVEICSRRQRRIISQIWPCLRPGGILIYSTCTYNTRENEENIDWITRELGAETLPLDPPEPDTPLINPTHTSHHVYRFLPHKLGGEGFFMAVLRKTNTHSIHDNPKKDFRTLLAQKLRVLQAGIAPATAKGKDVVPSHAMAMSVDSHHHSAYPVVNLSHAHAIAYLRKEAIVLPPDAPRGYVLLAYNDALLGFAKNIGNRANNMYPPEWRIRSGYLPEEIKTLGDF